MTSALELDSSRDGWPDAAVEALAQAQAEIAELRTEVAQLRVALESRVVIEQAKGVLAERFFLVPDQAFEAMRRAARSESRDLHELAQEIVASTRTPPGVVRQEQRRWADDT
jgi:AmiR/NasT family two-component response regulator